MMKQLTVILALSISGSAAGQNLDPNYEVATWPGFTKAAVTYTFDDNCPKQYTVVIPMFNEFGFAGTFYPVTTWSPQWADFQAAADMGHEIGSHTVTHPRLDTMDLSGQEAELRNSLDTINSRIIQKSGMTIAYPYCVPSDAALTKELFIAARHCQGQIEKSTPSNFYNISSIICGESGSVKTVAHFISRFNSAANSSGWIVFLIHGIDGDGGYSSLNSDTLRGSLEYLDDHRDTHWVATFGNVVRYIRERNNISISETAIGSDTILVEVSDTLDNEIYDLPVTLRRKIPAAWGIATVMKDGDTLDHKIVVTDTEVMVEFDVVPDDGPVKIVNMDNTSVRPLAGPSSIKIFPNPFYGELQVLAAGEFHFQLFSVTGRLISEGSGSGEIRLGEGLVPGMYFLNVNSDHEMLHHRIVKL